MSRPEDIPQDVWDAANIELMKASIEAKLRGETAEPVECIARAIMAAERRGEEREREAIFDLMSDACWDRKDSTGKDALIECAAAIRARGTA